MKKTAIILSALALTLTTFAQMQPVDMYVVNDPDGWVYLREGPDTVYRTQSLERLTNNSVILRDHDRPIVNGWVPVISPINRQKYYVHQSRLLPVAEPYALKLNEEIQHGHTAYMMSRDIPNLFVITDDYFDPIVLIDLNSDKIIFEAGGSVNFGIIWSDTLSFILNAGFYSYATGNTRLNPMLAIYKLFEKNGEYDLYTELYPEPRKISKEEAEQFVKNTVYTYPYYEDVYRRLFLAHCSGVDAWDALKNVPADGEVAEAQYIYELAFDAYDRSKLKPKK